ncbi:MAG TPA: helicase-related protein [Gemmatimonadales bacterium]|nr:helicase-related protein [Gemmatimonadales bacterium]
MHPTRDHALPPDPEAYRRARHPNGRVLVIAPTRAACETIELALGLHLDTLLEREHGQELRDWAAGGKGFGIVAGTGVGKTLGIRPIAESILREPLRVGVVNREREATPDTPNWNVVIVTTGIARRWFEDELILPTDTLVVDEIHQTSAELELCLALGKRVGCRFIWLSATVDPTFYAKYLHSSEVLVTRAFDPRLRARVEVKAQTPEEFLDEKYMKRLIREKRGVAVFVPTRKEVEKLATDIGGQWQRLTAAFYHGGEPIRVIRPFLEGEVERPFLLAMTAAGQSALNVRGLDTVIIYDARYANKVDRGRNVLHRLYLGANEILQMAGRVHGRVANGEVTILSDRELVFEELRPTPPEFQLAGDAEQVAITCAAMGVDATDLDLPVPLDRTAYRRALRTLTERGLVEEGRLTSYGREVEAMPVERPWGELLVHAEPDLVPMVAVCSNIDSLHRMTRDERDLHGAMVNGSDHLTAYNLYAEAVNQCGRVGSVYGLPRHVFEEEPLAEWAERRGVLVKSIEDTALGTASVYRALELPLPPTMPYAGKNIRQMWQELLARYMPFDLVIDEHTADGQEARISRTSVAGAWGAVCGNLRYFADRFGVPRASIEGTTLPYEMIREHAAWGPPRLVVTGPRKHQRLTSFRRLAYFGFELEEAAEEITGEIPHALLEQAHEALVSALLAGETPHPDQGRIKRAVQELDELWRRSGATLVGASPNNLRAVLGHQLSEVRSWPQFLATRLRLEVPDHVAGATRAELLALPNAARVLGDVAPIFYEIADGEGIARIALREGQARRARPQDLPTLDRPLRFAILRNRQGPAMGDTLADAIRALRFEERERDRGGRGHRDGRPGGGPGRGKGGGGKSHRKQRHQGKGRRGPR